MVSFGANDGRTPAATRADALARQFDRILEVERHIRSLHAERAALVDEARRMSDAAAEADVAESRTPSRAEHGWTARVIAQRELATELGSVLQLSEPTARRLIDESRALSELSGTREALATGDIGYRHAQRIVDHAESLPAEARADFERAVLPVARTGTAARLDRAARVERERHHPETITIRRATAVERRDVVFEAARDGMGWLTSYLPAEVALAGVNRLTDIAASLQSHDEPRTLAQLRADVLADLLIDGATESVDDLDPALDGFDENDVLVFRALQGALAEQFGEEASLVSVARACGRLGGHGTGTGDGTGHDADADSGLCPGVGHRPGPTDDDASGGGTGHRTRRIGARRGVDRGIRPTVMVIVPVLSLLGHHEQPATLEGCVPIDPAIARGLAAAAPSLTRLLTHPETGAVLSVGRDSHPVPPDLRRYLVVRDGTCRFPGCSRSARRCDVDHSLDYGLYGETAHDNLAHLCPSHHRVKHRTSWSVRHRARGTLEWTSPTGRSYLTEPELRLPAPESR